MKEYLTTSMIDAPLERVWAILTDGSGYSEWNPEIIRIDGSITAGGRMKTHVRLGNGAVRAMTQRVELDAPRRMVWEAGLPLKLFVGRRTFTLTPVGSRVEFRMHLRMSGPLSGPIIKSVGDRQPEIDRFSAAIKKRSEATRA